MFDLAWPDRFHLVWKIISSVDERDDIIVNNVTLDISSGNFMLFFFTNNSTHNNNNFLVSWINSIKQAARDSI